MPYTFSQTETGAIKLKPRIVALDVDFKRIHAWSSHDGRVCYKEPDWRPFADILAAHDIILMEVFSPIVYHMKDANRNKAAEQGMLVNVLKAALFNARICGEISQWMRSIPTTKKFLVSPSSSWSSGYVEEIRHEMAGVTGEDNHDLRECRSMLFFHGRNPHNWVPVDKYYEDYKTNDGYALKGAKTKPK